MPRSKAAGLTRRQVLKVGGAATFAGYAVGVEKVLGQAIKTDTQGIVAGDAAVAIGGYQMPVYEARPASATNAPIVIVISEVWGVHEWVKDVTRRFAKDGYHAVAPELFKREGGVGHIPNVQDILKIVLAVPRKQMLGDVAAAVDWAKKRPGARADRVGVTGIAGAAPRCTRWRRPTPTSRRRWRGTARWPGPSRTPRTR